MKSLNCICGNINFTIWMKRVKDIANVKVLVCSVCNREVPIFMLNDPKHEVIWK